ncbi:hypothetical protein ACJ3XI_02430 [Litorimonas sp. RW-G-Af-16]|uniref:hypothetical protein n=1 Tax=Litorimonas sp. RW-G-Af-16 TaxID=3241168 RepID=UPI00390CCA18
MISSAAWALIGVVIGALLSGLINYLLQKQRFKHDKDMFLTQNQSTEMVKALLLEMMSHKSYTDRKFEALKKPIGGYSDDRVRQLLHELNAKKVDRDGEEWWYLVDREQERIAHLKAAKQKKSKA